MANEIWVVATQTFFIFTPIPWGRFPILTNIFQMGWFNHQPEKCLKSISSQTLPGLSPLFPSFGLRKRALPMRA